MSLLFYPNVQNHDYENIILIYDLNKLPYITLILLPYITFQDNLNFEYKYKSLNRD